MYEKIYIFFCIIQQIDIENCRGQVGKNIDGFSVIVVKDIQIVIFHNI